MAFTIKEFEQILTQRVLLDKVARRADHPDFYRVILSNAFYATNEILRDYGLNDHAWPIKRGKRLYLLHPQTRRIICEIGVMSSPYVEFRVITLRGVVPATETLENLIRKTEKRGVRRDNLNKKGTING